MSNLREFMESHLGDDKSNPGNDSATYKNIADESLASIERASRSEELLEQILQQTK